MTNSNTAKLLILKDKSGHALRMIQTQKTNLCLVQNIETKRLEFLEYHLVSKSNSYWILEKIEFNQKDNTIPIKNVGSICIYDSDSMPYLDPKPLTDDEPYFPKIIKWSSGVHGSILGLLVLFAFIIKTKPINYNSLSESTVTIHLDKTDRDTIEQKTKTASVPPQKNKIIEQVSSSSNKNKVVRVVPRTHKNKSLLVTKSGRSKLLNSSNSASTQFQRLGSLGAISNAIKGSRHGIGSGLRTSGNGSGGFGRGAGVGRGNGTMGHGHDSGGGYAQALYGKGLIAGQVGGGDGGFGSGWGEGTRGSGSFGTKGKGGGHEGYGTSKIGSGASSFSYPVKEEAVVEGGLDREAVDLVVMKNLGQIIYCYEMGLQQKVGLRGRVLVDFTINSQGRVSSCSISNSSLRSAQVENCMMNKIKNWKFPQPVGGVNVDVNYPFALQRVAQN